ncbi:MAG: zinc metallopeptidase [Bacteroidales bacterium]|nr:zinc metallopeptidase [Bacteroidales bacterium]MBQ7985213.1 zinc metallopeptidase [Bacteroidales bacterium]
MGANGLYWLIFIATAVVSWIISNSLRKAFKEYSNIPSQGNITGREVAQQMLHDNDIYDVQITCIEGQLTDNYNPVNKTLNLSKAVYFGDNVAAAAVAAHECGHAVQHAHAYAPLQMRSALVPVVSFASKWVMWVLLAGMLLIKTFPSLMLIGIILFAATTLFSFVTLPVEIDASKRALQWLNVHNITTPQSHPKAQRALRLAAYTYVVAALGSLATLLYYVMIFSGARRD